MRMSGTAGALFGMLSGKTRCAAKLEGLCLCSLAVKEALAMEPQCRLLLEETYMALMKAEPATGVLLDSLTGELHR
jgi:hypothetical protein